MRTTSIWKRTDGSKKRRTSKQRSNVSQPCHWNHEWQDITVAEYHTIHAHYDYGMDATMLHIITYYFLSTYLYNRSVNLILTPVDVFFSAR